MNERGVYVELGSVADLKTGYPFKSANYSNNVEDPRLVRGDNVVQGETRWDNAKRWPMDQTQGLESYWLRENDVVLAMDRPWIEAGLKRTTIRRADLPALLVQRVARLRGSDMLDTGFLGYVTASRDFTNYILAVQTGTAIPHISAEQIKGFKFRLPPIEEQHAIAHILGTLDDKIELNRRMNETLEAMARAIFKSWFVDFDPVRVKAEGRDPGLPKHTADLFPDRFEDSELGEIPEGWTIEPLDQVAHFLNGLALQKYPQEDSEYLPAIKIAELRKGVTASSGRASTNIPAQYVVENGDVLFSWSGSLEVQLWTGGRGALNQHLFKVTSQKYPDWFYYYWIKHHLTRFRDIAADKATTMGHIKRHHLTDALTTVPPLTALEAMSATTEPIMSKMVNHDLEARTLAAIRDALLPKLLSGEVRVGDAENIVEETA